MNKLVSLKSNKIIKIAIGSVTYKNINFDTAMTPPQIINLPKTIEKILNDKNIKIG